MNKLMLLILLLLSSKVFSEDFRYPAEYSLLLKQDSELYDYAFPAACGASITLRGVQLAHELDMFHVDWVMELSEKHEIINKWPTPLSSIPIAVKGDKLYLKTFDKVNPVISIYPDGNISPDELENSSEPMTEKCPVVNEHENIHKHYYCTRIKDRDTGITRFLAVVPLCT